MEFNARPSIKLAALVAALSLVSLNAACAAPQTPAESQANRPPVIQQITGASDLLAATTADITCVATDPDGDKLTYAWTADNGTLQGSGPTISWTSPETMGKYNISVTAADGRGGEVTQVYAVRVIMNADGSITADAPAVLKMSLPSKDTVIAAKRVRIWTSSPIECIVEGEDAGNLKYSWTSANGKLQAGKGLSLEGGTARKVNWIAPGAGGDYIVYVTVTDGSGNEAKGQVNFKAICCGNE